MKKMMKKTNVVLLTCLMAIIAFCGVCFAKSAPQTVSAENATTETSITGVQLRADVNGDCTI